MLERTTKKSHAKRLRTTLGAAHLAEFAAAISLLTFCLVIPLLVSLKIVGTILLGQYITDSAIYCASKSNSFDEAMEKSLFQMRSNSKNLSILQMKPCGGYKNSGIQLQAEMFDTGTKKFSFGACNQGSPNVTSQTGKEYSLTVSTQFEEAALFGEWKTFAAPYLTAPVVFHFSANRICEREGSAIAANFKDND